ncbi:hypothetical protein ASPCADRAFT_8842 [Aspergillus carbonarius ITEM 5010]|uniref:Uncharacterized protein n=1 Tax=Aspergillus carbonarius (strain ITEM 5010) TaxID=602072 RepID=A0A1R3RDL3_ASPC5|nr:hypothetical protein ASPCADRAFT_8842 [Aspergillus carbonarius ITEM 5010]
MNSHDDAESVSSNNETLSSDCSDTPLSESLFDENTVKYHMSLLPSTHREATTESTERAPIASSHVLNEDNKITQYGLLGGSTHALSSTSPDQPPFYLDEDPRLFFNITHPSRIFIYDSQGSGKSHTLSCLLENCLIPSKAGRLANPLTAVVFHYDMFTSDEPGYPCEAVSLSWALALQIILWREKIALRLATVTMSDRRGLMESWIGFE